MFKSSHKASKILSGTPYSSESVSILSTVDSEMTRSTIGRLSSFLVISLTFLIVSGL